MRPDPRNENFLFSPAYWLILPHLAATSGTMRTMAVVLGLALISIAFAVYSDSTLTSGQISPSAPDPAAIAIAHGLKRS
jgi:hypothetical protein